MEIYQYVLGTRKIFYMCNSNSNTTFIALNLCLLTDAKVHNARNVKTMKFDFATLNDNLFITNHLLSWINFLNITSLNIISGKKIYLYHLQIARN